MFVKRNVRVSTTREDDSRGLKFLMSLDVSVSKEIISSFDEMPPCAREREAERERWRERNGLEEEGWRQGSRSVYIDVRKMKAISSRQEIRECVIVGE